MRYTYKERIKLAKKLKVFLAIFFAATVFFTGKVILDKTFAENNDYGTATITFNSGEQGQFEDGTTTNTVTYKLTKKLTKYSHTPNYDDEGNQSGSMGGNANFKDIVSIPGAKFLHVEITIKEGYAYIFQGGNTNTDESYTNKIDANSGTINRTYDIPGDAITISYGTSAYGGDGYYAVITGESEDGELALGDVIAGEYKEPASNYNRSFSKWDTNLKDILTDTTLTAEYNNNPIREYDGVNYQITSDGTLFIGKANETQEFTYRQDRSESDYPWRSSIYDIKKVRFLGTVKGNGSFKNMFYSLPLKDVDLSNFDTSNVTSMAYMFSDCRQLSNINVNVLNTENVTSMQYMFYKCLSLTSLDFSNRVMENVQNMTGMFENCKNLVYLDMSNITIPNTINMSEMFYSCGELRYLDTSNFNVSNVTDMSKMFSGCKKLINIDLSGFNTSNVISMKNLFENCRKVVNIYQSFDTSLVEDMSKMFSDCEQLKNINLTNFNTSNVINMYGMFLHCKSLNSIDVSSFDVSKVTTMLYMFDGCSKLTVLDLSNFNTESLTNASYMFAYNSNLKQIDLTNFNAMNLEDSSYMFNSCSSLDTIVVGINWKFTSGQYLTGNWQSQVDGETYSISQLYSIYDGSTMAGTYKKVDKQKSLYAKLDSEGVLSFYYGNYYNDEENIIVYENFENANYNSPDEVPWYQERNEIKTIIFKGLITPRSTAYWFYGTSNLKNIKNINNLITYNVENMTSMFEESGIGVLDLSSFNTTNVTAMTNMFKNCTNLTYLDISSFKTINLSNEYSVQDVFLNTNIKRIVVGDQVEFNIAPNIPGDWKSDKSNTIYSGNEVFGAPSGIYTEVDSINYALLYENGELVFQNNNTPDSTKGNLLSEYDNFENSNNFSTDTVPWLEYSDSITEVTFTTEIIPLSTAYWFYHMKNLTTINSIEYLVTNNVLDMSNMFNGCSNLVNLDITTFDTDNVTDMSYMFSDCSKLENIDLSNLETQQVKNMEYFMNNCKSIETISLTNYTSYWIENLQYMFNNCEELSIIDIGYGFNVWNATSISHMFSNCINLMEVYLYNGSIQDMSYAFYNCKSLVNLSLSDLRSSGTTDMTSMFEKCENLQTVDIRNFTTYDCKKTMRMFSDCYNLQSIITGEDFTLEKAWNTSYMFNNCYQLEGLDTSKFQLTEVVDASYMFNNCKNLTTLDTSSFNITKIKDMSHMFNNCEKLRSLDIKNILTSNTTNMEKAFYGCKNINYLNLSNQDTSNVVNMTNMLNTLTSIRSIKLGENFKFLSDCGLEGNWKRDDDDTIYSAETLINSYVGSTMNGTYRKSGVNVYAHVYENGELIFTNDDDLIYTDINLINKYSFSEEDIFSSNDEVPWKANKNVITKVIFKDEIIPRSTAYWFYGMTNLKKLKKVENLNTETTINMNSMFEGCSKISSLVLKNIKTDEVNTMSAMFKNCTNLVVLDISNFHVTKLHETGDTAIAEMFTNTDLRTIIIGNSEVFDILPELYGVWYSNNSYVGNKIFQASAGTYTRDETNVSAILYDSGEMVFQKGDTPDETKGEVVEVYSGFEVETYDANSSYRVPWYSERNTITKVSFKDEIVPISTANWFCQLENLEEIENIELLNTENVTSMDSMFAGTKLRSLDLSSFDTSNVTSMDSLFADCINLSVVDLSSFDTSKVESMYGTFADCYNLLTIELSSFDTSNVINMNNMFNNCQKLRYLDLSNFNTQKNCKYMDSMLLNTVSLERISLGQNMKLDSEIGLSNYWTKEGENNVIAGEILADTYDGSTMAGTYVLAPSRAEIYDTGIMVFRRGNDDLENYVSEYGDNVGIETLGNLVATYTDFEDREYSTYTDVPWYSNRNVVTKVYTMDQVSPISTAYWFYDMENVEEIHLYGMMSSDVQNMKYMFANCINLEKIYFNQCGYSSWDSKEKSKKMEMSASPTYRLNYSVDFDTSNVTDMSYMFYNCETIQFLNFSSYRINNSSSVEKYASKKYVKGDKVVATPLLQYGYETDTCLNAYNSTYFDTSNVTNMEKMFSGCTSLERLDISSFDTNKVTSMDEMFKDTSSLKRIGLGEKYNFLENTMLSKSWIREGDTITYTAEELTNTYDGTTMAGTYRSTDDNFVLIYDSGEMVFQYGNTPDETKGNLVATYFGFEEEQYKDDQMPPWVEFVEEITKVTFETEISPISTYSWFSYMINLEEINNIEYLNTENVKNMSGMFDGCMKLKNLDLSTFDTSNVENMRYMFSHCSSITSLDLSGFDTSKTYDMSEMFGGCTALEILDISSFDTGEKEVEWHGETYYDLTATKSMFNNTPNLRVLVLGEEFKFFFEDYETNSGLANSWQRDGDTVEYTATELMQQYDGSTMAGVYRKTTPPIPYVLIYDSGEMVFQVGDTPDETKGTVINSYYGFENKEYNDSLLPPWYGNNSSITKVTFEKEMAPVSTSHWFDNMKNLTTIDNIELLNTSHTTNMSSMFKNCEGLTTLDLTFFATSKVTDMSHMFDGCTNMRYIDLFDSSTENVTDMSYMFNNCSKLVLIETTALDTGNVTDMSSMFNNCSNLYELDLYGFDTNNVTDMSNMFANTNRLRILYLGSDYKFLDNNGLTKKWKTEDSDTIYTAEELTALYDGETMSGRYLAMSLLTVTEQVKGSIADTNKNFEFTITMIDEGDGLVGNFPYTGSKSGNLEFENGEATFTLKHGENIDIELPSGYYTYEIVQNNEEYTLAKSGDVGNLEVDRTASFTDTLEGTTPTGLLLNIIPYIIMLIIGISGIIAIKRIKV